MINSDKKTWGQKFISNDIILRGTFHLPTNFFPKSKWPIVIMATGDGRKGSGSSTWKPLIEGTINCGIPVFIFDFHGLGKSDGDFSDLSITVAVQNLRDAVRFVKTQAWVDCNRLGILGSSFGGTAALIVSALDMPFKVVGLKSPASFLPEAYENEHGEEGMEKWRAEGISPITGFKYKAYLDAFRYNVYELCKQIKTRILIVHGDSDTIVPLRQSKRLTFILGNIAELKILPGVDHDYKQNGALDKLVQYQTSFFKRYL
jgi:dipeptidyl aminopeptidase/acylaminoacyl peptidase